MQEFYKSSKTLAKNHARVQEIMQEMFKDSCMISDENRVRFLQDKYHICKNANYII